MESFGIIPLGDWIQKYPHIWQMDLLKTEGFANFVRIRGLGGSYNNEFIKDLWKINLIKADLILSKKCIEIPSLKTIGKNCEGYLIYIDKRKFSIRKEGWTDAIQHNKIRPNKIELFFHPFRYYIIYNLDRILRPSISPRQILISSKNYSKLIKIIIDQFNKYTSNSDFVKRLNEWNYVTNLAIAAEPCAFPKLFGFIKFSPASSLQRQREEINKHWDRIIPFFRNIGEEETNKFICNLCIEAEILDPNKSVHTILRLTQGMERFNLEGNLGGSICLLTMAETIRRCAEKAFNIKLKEEDELGFGWTPPNLKKYLYGSNRLLDGNHLAIKNYLQQHGLDYSVRLRWYVEGETEYGAISALLKGINAIQVINLRGRVVQKKELAFRDSLKDDLNSNVFSLISIDSDRNDFVNAVRKAAKDNLICGMFFISRPDFEFENFTNTELMEIIWQIAVKEGAKNEDRKKLMMHINTATSGEQLIKNARKALPQLNRISKGERWGKSLGEYAIENPYTLDAAGKEILRPFMEAVNKAINSTKLNYYNTRRDLRINPSTGKLEKFNDLVGN